MNNEHVTLLLPKESKQMLALCQSGGRICPTCFKWRLKCRYSGLSLWYTGSQNSKSLGLHFKTAPLQSRTLELCPGSSVRIFNCVLALVFDSQTLSWFLYPTLGLCPVSCLRLFDYVLVLRSPTLGLCPGSSLQYPTLGLGPSAGSR